MPQDKLDKLKQQKQRIQERINQEEKKQRERDRKQDTRRNILIGAYCLSLLNDEKDVQIKNKMELRKKMDHFLTKDSDRKLFNLKPLSPSKSSKPKSSESDQNNQNQKQGE